MFTSVNGIFEYLPTYKAYHWRLLEELYEDNVMYLEMRSGLGSVGSSCGFQMSDKMKLFFF